MPHSTAPPARPAPGVVELRRYALHPGRRDTLIELFERELVEPQEALGMQVLGTFRELDDADRFTWLRGFDDMASRRRALEAFYGGPVWQRHRDAANATMIDSDDVLLLRPARPLSGFAPPSSRAPVGATTPPAGLITATVCPLGEPADEALIARLESTARAHAAIGDAELVACLVSETARNDYPRLPVREGEPMAVWFSRFADAAAQRRHAERLAASVEWRDRIWPAWRTALAADPSVLRLAPTARSALHR